MKIRVLACILSISMASVLMEMPVLAETEGYFEYSVVDGKAEITGIAGDLKGNVVIPSTLGGYPVTSITEMALSRAFEMNSVTIPDTVTSISSIAFPSSDSLTSINVNDANTAFTSEAGVLFNKDKTVLISFPSGKGGSYIIPDSVTTIGESAFTGCMNLQSVTIPDSVKVIEDGAFIECSSLTTLSIPAGVESLGFGAISNCGTKNIILHEGLKHIYDYALFGTDYETIYIPSSIESLGTFTFDTLCITDIYYAGSEDDWKKVSISDESNDNLSKATIHYNSPAPDGGTMQAAANTEPAQPTGMQILKTDAGTDWQLEITDKQIGSDSINAAIVAVYDGSGVLINVSYKPISSVDSANVSVAKTNSGKTAKVFLWSQTELSIAFAGSVPLQ